MSGIEGRKAIVLITSGIDTFSKITFDQTPQEPAGIGRADLRHRPDADPRAILTEAYGMMGSIQRMDFLQADNEMRTFAKETGGQAFFPRFQGEYPAISRQIHQALRNQYVLTYSPTQQGHDGTFRKIKVELVNPATNEPLPMKDEKGKPMKYDRRQGRLQSSARSGVIRSNFSDSDAACTSICQALDLAIFQDDANPLTGWLRLCYSRIRP